MADFLGVGYPCGVVGDRGTGAEVGGGVEVAEGDGGGAAAVEVVGVVDDVGLGHGWGGLGLGGEGGVEG